MAGIGDITGTLESGKCADMIVVEKNPLEDLRVLRNVDMVIAQGKSDPCSQGEEKADRRDGVGQISELEWNGNVCLRRIELYSDA